MTEKLDYLNIFRIYFY